MRKATNLAALAAFCTLATVHAPHVRAAEVLVSLKPLHALVAAVMGETGEPRLMVSGAASPHTYRMRPSDAEVLNAADLVVWVGEGMERFLDRPLAVLGSGADVVTLHEAAGMELLPNRGSPLASRWCAGTCSDPLVSICDNHNCRGLRDPFGLRFRCRGIRCDTLNPTFFLVRSTA